MAWISCPKCGCTISSFATICRCGFSLVTNSMAVLAYHDEFNLHDWNWFLRKETKLEKRWALQVKLRQVAAIAAEEAGSSSPDAMYRRGCESIEHSQMSGERSITMRLGDSVAYTPACTLFAILNQLEHIEHPTTSGRWIITLDTPQYRDPSTHMYTRVGLPGYYSLLPRLNSWMHSADYPSSYTDPTAFLYDAGSATFTLTSSDFSFIPRNYRKAVKIVIGPEVGTVPEELFSKYEYLEEVITSPNVYGIGASAFAGCPVLKTVHLPDSIREIGSSAFAGCTQLTEVNIQTTSPVRIGSQAFSLCPIRPTCNPSVNAEIDNLTMIQAEIENDDFSSMKFSGKTFFEIGKPVLVDGTGNWETDCKEAIRRMDTFFSTAPFLRRFSKNSEIHGTWYYHGIYCHIFSSRSYNHYHDGDSISQTDVTVSRISAKTYYDGKTDSVGNENIRAQWLTDAAIMARESERYFMSAGRFRAKNFLGMVGFYEIHFSSD